MLLELFGGDIKFFKGKSSCFPMEHSQEKVALAYLSVVFILLTLSVIGGIEIFPFY